MLSKSFLFLVILILLIGVCSASAQLKKVRFSTTGISISELPFKVAQVKGFWREEGLDVETILIRGAVGMQALLGRLGRLYFGLWLDHRGGRARFAGQTRVYFIGEAAVRTHLAARRSSPSRSSKEKSSAFHPAAVPMIL